MMALKKLILTADDFGSSPSINDAIFQAHQKGVLTGASLMVSGEAMVEAVRWAHDHPSFAVGLHVVLVDGKSTLPPHVIPHLADQNGRFPDSPLIAGLRCISSQAARNELKLEINAQFEQFSATGLPLDHVNSHLHFHVHPYIFPLIISLSQQYNAAGIRIPYDDLIGSLIYDHHQSFQKITWAFIFGLFNRIYRPKVLQTKLAVTDRVFGLMQSGQMKEDYLTQIFQNYKKKNAEVYFHPDTHNRKKPLGPNPTDLHTLTSPSLRQAIDLYGFNLTTYSNLGK